ncbi:MAG: nitrate reductase [Campylobacteraceae bacterium]|nr:nitrate reductase [Campylobacteraceae bacterium]
MKILSLLILLLLNLHSKTIKASYIINTKEIVSDFVFNDKYLFIANIKGSIEIFDFQSKKMVNEIIFPLEQTLKGKLVRSKILSIDELNNKLLIVRSSVKAFREVWVYENRILRKIISLEDKLSIKEARFASEGKIILSSLGNELMSYDLNESYMSYKRQIEESYFTDMELSSDKKTLVSASESGIVSLIDVKTGDILKTFSSENVDSIYKLAYVKGTIITAGKDRRVGVYQKGEKAYHLKSNFLIYCVALSPSALNAIYTKDEDSNLEVFSLKSKKSLYTLEGHFAVVDNIKFINEYELFSSGAEKKIFYWKLK